MKRCTVCSRNYPDDQNFCLEDGSTLVGAPVGSFDSADSPTANFHQRGGSAQTEFLHGTPTTNFRPVGTSPPPPYITPYQPQKRSSAPWIVGGLLVLVGGIAAVVFLSSRSGTSGIAGGGPTPAATPSYSPTYTPTTTPTTTATPSSSSWETISGDRFSISMPGTPSHNEDTIPSAAGPLQLHMYTLSQGFEGFITGYTEYPDIVFESAEPEKLLDGAQQGAISNVKGEVTSQRRITLNGNPGREIVGTSPSQNIGFTARVYLARPRMYMLVYTQYDKDKPISEDGTRFLDSFQITR